MSVRFSLVYPTRHRPEFVRQALMFLKRQAYPNFEVIVSDNYVDPALSCRDICERADIQGLRYVRPPEPLGMVENWNYALRYATGDYVCYFTDKMFLLPDTLSRAAAVIEAIDCEILTWVDGSYSPRNYPDYFGPGIYRQPPQRRSEGTYTLYDPREALSIKGRARVSRNEQDRSTYTRGKICFGTYRADLLDRIVSRSGKVFHPISPDYTSMVLGLSLAGSAAEIHGPGIVHVHTDLSNGGRIAARDEAAIRFLGEYGPADSIAADLPVPGLYSTLHNLVSHDYLTLRRRFGLDFEFNLARWLVYMAEDLEAEGREWSSSTVEKEQRTLLQAFLKTLSAGERATYQRHARRRQRARSKQRLAGLIRGGAKAVLPSFMVDRVRSRMTLQRNQSGHAAGQVGRYCQGVSDLAGRDPRVECDPIERSLVVDGEGRR